MSQLQQQQQHPHKQKNFGGKLMHWVKKKDTFGVPVSLTYKSDPFIKSTYGGLLTLLARIGIMTVLFIQCSSVINKDYIITSSFYRRNLATDNTEYTLTLDDLDYAVRVEYLFQDTQPEVANNLDQYVSITTSQAVQTWVTDSNGSARLQIKRTLLTLGSCTNGRMGLSADSEDYLSLKSKYLCPPNNFKYSLKGNAASREQKFISISLRQCNQSHLDLTYGTGVKQCKPYEDRLRIVQYLKVYIILRNSYFEEDNFSDNPTPNFLKPYFLAGRYNSSQLLYLLMSKNEISLFDSMLFGSQVNKTFVDTRMDYQLIQELASTDPSIPNPFIQINLMMDDQVKTVERKVLTFIDAAKSTGGMMSVIFTVSMMLAQRVQSKIYYTQLIKSMFRYQERVTQDNEEKGKKSQKKKQSKVKDQEEADNLQEFHSPEGLLKKIQFQIANRAKLKYSLSRAMCEPILKRCFKRTPFDNYQQKLYNIGLQKLQKEFDIRYFVKSMRLLKFISNILLTKHQREMLPFIKHNLLNYKEKKNKQDPHDDKVLYYLKNIIQNSEKVKLDKRILKAINLSDEDENDNDDGHKSGKRKNKTFDTIYDHQKGDKMFDNIAERNTEVLYKKSKTLSPSVRKQNNDQVKTKDKNEKWKKNNNNPINIGRVTANDLFRK